MTDRNVKRTLHMILFLFPSILMAQSKFDTVSFEILRNDKAIGQLSATRTENGDKVAYEVGGSIDKGLLLINTIKYELYVEYRYNKLYKSDLKIFVNNRLYKDVEIISNGNTYITTTKGGRKKELKEPITFSSVQLLFRAPEGVTKTFTEAKLKYRTIFPDSKDRNTYGIGESAKRIGYYYRYKQGRLVSIHINDIIDFHLVQK